MDQYLETELNRAFSTRASSIPSDAGVRLRALNYHPRTRYLSPRLTVGALGGVAATAGTVISVVVLGGAQPAFAGWSSSPSPASTSLVAAADAACQTQLASAPALSGSTTGSGWNAVTTDVRGPYTMAIFQDDSAAATCFIGPSFTVISLSNGNENENSMSVSRSTSGAERGRGEASSSLMVGGVESGDITHMTVAHLDSSSDGPYTLVEGQVEPDVTGVTLVRSDGSDVQATIGGGWVVAWWPSTQGVTTAEVTTPNGMSNQALNLAPLVPPLPPGGSGTSSTTEQGG